MLTVKTQTLGFHRNQARLWLNKGTIEDAKLKAGDMIVHIYDANTGELSIEKLAAGSTPSEKVTKIADTFKGAIIDLNNKVLTDFFADFEKVDVMALNEKIVVKGNFHENRVKAREEAFIRRVQTGKSVRKGGLFVGMGLLCKSVHEGMKEAGLNVKQRFANEYNPIAAEVNLAGNPLWKDAEKDAVFSIDDIYTMDKSIIPKLDVLVIGSPCPAFSQLNTQMQRDGKKDIFHPDSGTIFAPILEAIDASECCAVVLENSKFFSGSIFDYIMSDLMRRKGFLSTECVVNGQAHGGFEKRERLCRIWYSKGLPEPDLNDLPFQMENQRTFGEILEPMDLDDKRYARRTYLESKDAESHNGHKYCITPLDAKKIPTCGANYHKIQPDSALIAHPERPLETRIMTPSEGCNLRDIGGALKDNIVAVAKGEHYSQRLNRTSVAEAHKMLGNSCEPLCWRAVGYRFGEWMLNIAGVGATKVREATKLTVEKCEAAVNLDGDQFVLAI